MDPHSHLPQNEHPSHTPRFVLIEVDGHEREVPPGKYLVSDLKAKLLVPSEYELELVKHGKFEPLVDSDTINIEHPIKLVSHVRCGASS